MILEHLGIENNNLTIGGVDTVELAKEYGTPLYVLDENTIRKSCRAYVESMEKYYGGNGRILFASKAMCVSELCRIVNSENLGLDVVSGGEMYTAYKAGFPMDRVYFHGNNKTVDEIKMALEVGVGRFVVDNECEMKTISRLAKEMNVTANVLFRIKPGIDAHTHDFVRTGQIDSKFGVALETGEAIEIIKKAMSTENINYCGIHCHIASQVFEAKPFVEAAEVMMNFIKEIKDVCGLETKELNLGGGFGVAYTHADTPIEYDKYMEAVSKIIHTKAKELGVKLPYILMEPGRSIVASAGITLYTIGNVKEIPNIRTYVSVDGGMADNPRYIMYQAEYTFTIANKAAQEKTETVTVAGKCCESGDLLGEHVKLQRAEAGDILAVLTTGAYNYSMASHYNRIPNPAVVMVRDGESRVVVKRETYDDIIKNDL